MSRRPYANNTLGALNDALDRAADLAASALPPEQEEMAKQFARDLAGDPRHSWKGYEGCLRLARQRVQAAVKA